MVVLLPNELGKKIADFKKAKGKGWEKELAKAIDVLMAEELLLTPNPKQKLTETQAIKEATQAVREYRARRK
ncbi:MAG: hypothetical protein K6T57_14650 [Thermaceae bacterium]|nr:hypothetical protein [Thermaceae bacterium]